MLSDGVKRNRKVFEGLLNIDPEMRSLLADAQSRIKKIEENNSALFKMLRDMQPILEAFKPLNNLIKPAIEVHESIKRYVQARLKMAREIAIFPQNGWYLSSAFADTLDSEKLASFLGASDKIWNSDIEDVLMRAFEDDLEEITERITEIFTKRSHILRHIVELHKGRDYIACIPLALAQADGMCKDSFFEKVRGQKRPLGFFKAEPTVSQQKPQSLAKGIRVEETSVFSFLTNQLAALDRDLHPLLEANTKNLSDLNRNAILHGESVDYGSRVNSIKAILLLDFIADLVIANRYLTSEKYS
jgi:hypothetical protein